MSMVQPMEKVILANPRDVISVRVAEPGECRDLGLPLWQNKLIFVFTSPDGSESVHPADGVTVMLKRSESESDGTGHTAHATSV